MRFARQTEKCFESALRKKKNRKWSSYKGQDVGYLADRAKSSSDLVPSVDIQDPSPPQNSLRSSSQRRGGRPANLQGTAPCSSAGGHQFTTLRAHEVLSAAATLVASRYFLRSRLCDHGSTGCIFIALATRSLMRRIVVCQLSSHFRRQPTRALSILR